jgi:hypothetical protein
LSWSRCHCKTKKKKTKTKKKKKKTKKKKKKQSLRSHYNMLNEFATSAQPKNTNQTSTSPNLDFG